jgi:threonine/homoserine/homoserine lactone efflux protein
MEYNGMANLVQIAGAVFVIWLIWRWFNGRNGTGADSAPGMGNKTQ